MYLEGRWYATEADDEWMADKTGGIAGKNLFHNEKVLSPAVSCQPEQKLSFVSISGEVRLGSGEWGDRAIR